jgi:hypothetical protein
VNSGDTFSIETLRRSRDEIRPGDSRTFMVANGRVSQVVDIGNGVPCMIPKAIFVKK